MSENLPEKRNSGSMAKSDEDQKAFLKRIEKLLKIFNREPDKVFVTNYKNQFNYLPISHLETLLDEYFFGQWSVENFQYSQMVNEIVGSLELKVHHPITGIPIIRTGVASVVIMQDKDSKLSDFTNTKKMNALVMGFPRLKAECFKNAVQSLGKMFGRDINRDLVDNYTALFKYEETKEPTIEILRRNIIAELETYKGDDKEAIREMCAEKEKAGEVTEAFLLNIAHKLGMDV